ncbi:MAG: alkaline phosphatase family protein [Acidobacteria bacterium]|nr:alkaline phosphatase family protein [Acidobacteriota bacterium]
MNRRAFFSFSLAVALSVALSCARPAPPILILVSLDGFRAVDIDRLPVPTLRALAARGVRAKALIPSFPLLTFPNHYTLVTGLYPAHHGIIGNNISDPSFPERFSMSAKTAKDPRWWGGEPIWVTAIRQGRRAGTMFWPGSEVTIGGVRPTFTAPYDKNMPSADRVTQVLTWLALPEDQRPAFVSLYFEEIDSASHDHGLESPEIATAAGHLDAAIGQLVAGVRRLGLDDRITIVAVSDHGMTSLSTDREIYLDDALDLRTVTVSEWTGVLEISPKDGDVEGLYRHLHGRYAHLAIYRREDVPARLHYRDNPRIPVIVGIPDEGWAVTSYEREAARELDAATHGYDPDLPALRSLFVAAGPALRSGLVVEPFENVHVYDFLCAVLKLTPAPNDGNPAVTRAFLR